MKLLRQLAFIAIAGIILGVVFLVVLWPSRTSHERFVPLTVVVEASYPGANANVLADTVAAPIEQQVNGVEGMLRMQSYCSNDGKYSLVVSFARGTDLDMAQVLVMNRVNLALPVLPAAVNQIGISVRKKSPIVRALLVLTSPENRYNEIYLSNYADRQLRDELARVAGVGDVELLGKREYGVQIWLDQDKLAARGLTAVEVVKALQEQNLQANAGATPEAPKGNNIALTVNLNVRLETQDGLDNVIVKVRPNGNTVLLRDVTRVERAANGDDRHVRFDGKPAVAIAIHPLSPQVDAKTVLNDITKKVDELRGHFPEGLTLDLAFEFSPQTRPDVIMVDVELPAGASAERIQNVLDKCDAVIRRIPGTTRTLTALQDPFAASRRRPNILAGIEPDKQPGGREKMMADVRHRLVEEIPEAAIRVADLAAPGWTTPGGYPIAFAICDIADSGYEALSKHADRIVQRLWESPLLSDVGTTPSHANAPQWHIDIDRQQAAALGVAIADIQTTLQTALGGVDVGDINQFGRTWQVIVRSGPEFRLATDTLLQMRVANAKGELVPLSALVTLRETMGPTVVMRRNLYPAIEISANPATGASLREAQKVCEKIVAEEIGPAFKMEGISAAK